MRSLIDIMQLTTAEIDELVALGSDIIANPENSECDGKNNIWHWVKIVSIYERMNNNKH